MELKHNSLFFGGQENIEAYCSATIVCKGKGHQQARKVDKPKAIGEKLRENCEKLRNRGKLHKIADLNPPPSPGDIWVTFGLDWKCA